MIILVLSLFKYTDADFDVSISRRSSTGINSKSVGVLSRNDGPTGQIPTCKDHHVLNYSSLSTLSPCSSSPTITNSNENHKMFTTSTGESAHDSNSPNNFKLPTRTLHVSGLIVGPTEPDSIKRLTNAFRKFGDIIVSVLFIQNIIFYDHYNEFLLLC